MENIIDYDVYFDEEFISFYEEVRLSKFHFDKEKQIYKYLCPCGDFFQISLEELEEGENVAKCPSCSLIVLVITE
ncbi:DPH3 [Hepatospora eriocheir]|uniref:Diphthamide biosynthesis protein 3 n=1 Tax=Hepatospora eriocheir TaxID=1081669 RepID=A0A1X0QBX5_9MICR|nr:DPH3 [Hepatospora eriocheir]ORD99680.1 DPH3 [Hepatospora eriocheir]